MFCNLILGFLSIILGIIIGNFIAVIIGLIWLITPAIINIISKPVVIKNKYEELDEKDKEYIINIGEKTWNYFKDYLTEKTNYLPPDNYQENRKNKIALRTSPTNIGLAILSVISSYDLGLENKNDTLDLINKMIETIEKLPKWNGHLFNWYDISNLEPLYPKYVSSVDSGNFIGYLFVLKQFLIKENNNSDIINNNIKTINKIINNTDFSKLFIQKAGLFSIGFNCEENKLTDSYYDLLASEARQTSLVAIAKKDVSAKHWKNLGRALTTLNKYKGLISWSGTAFEYLMPAINIKRYPGSLLDESCKFMIMSQIEYAKKIGTTWGISEAAFNLKDFKGNYQYKAFGIPWLGLKRGLADEIVVSAYGTILAINDVPQKVISNLKELEKCGMYNKYGFYESIDYTPCRTGKNNKYSIVRTYMAHHQGLILLSINNLINNNILQERFFDNPEIASIDVLLQEKMPENVIITKEKKEHVEKIKYTDFDYYSERIFEKNKLVNGEKYNLISNNNYSILIDSNGNGYSRFNDIYINRYKRTEEQPGGILFYLKDQNNNIWNPCNTSNNKIVYYPDRAEFIAEKNKIKAKVSVFISSENSVEIRNINIKNTSNYNNKLEFYSIFDPVLSPIKQDYAHKAFNKLFLTFDYIDNILLIKRGARSVNENDLYLAVTLISDEKNINNFEYEVNKLSAIGRNNYDIPDCIKESRRLNNSTNNNTNQIVALKKLIELGCNDEVNFSFIISISNNRKDAIDNANKFNNIEAVKRAIKLSKAQTEANIQYMEMTGKDVNLCERMISQMLNNCGKIYSNKDKYLNLSKSNLWKFGISGEHQIVVFQIEEIMEIDVLRKLIKCYEYFKYLNNKIDLIIINNEEQSYEKYLQDSIDEVLWQHTADINNGIFILKNISFEDKKILEYRADLFIPGKCGKIDYFLDELELNNNKKIKMYNNTIDTKLGEEQDRDKYNYTQELNEKNLELFNGYGGFKDKEYIIKINKNKTTPLAWSNILANEKFGTVVTENYGGYTWYKNSRLNRITVWNNDSVSDYQSELIYFEDKENNCIWNASLGPVKDNGEYSIIYGLGYAKYNHETENIKQEITVFIPKNDSVKINLIKLKNLLPQKRKIKVSYYLKLVLGEGEIESDKYIYDENNKQNNYILLKNLACDFNYWTFISSNEKIINYEKNNNIIKINFEIEISAYEEKNILLFFGCEDKEDNCTKIVNKYREIEISKDELNNVIKYWDNLTGKIAINTPVDSVNHLCNGWIFYQTYCSRMLARSGYYQSGGAYGFRDQLQDSMCMKYLDLDIEKNQILKHAAHQFIEGDVLHWWHDETGRGIRTRFSDDLLWLPYVVYDYIEYSGDYSILDIDIPYLKGEILEENIDEKYDYYELSDTKENIYCHCIKSINRSLNMGKNGIPKIGSGDWNDGFNLIGNKGEGESVWLGFFLYNILNKFIKICDYKKDYNNKSLYQNIVVKLKDNLNKNCWDGRWFNRAFCDDGRVIGSIKNQECKIDGISQSWAVISNCTDKEKKEIAMDNLANYLVDKKEGIIKLLDPPFEKEDITPGYIKSYLPGVRENGGQYTHGAIWAIIAEAMLNRNNLAFEFFRIINPIEHSYNKEKADRYKIEPYVIAADIYSNNDMYGQGGWSWYTGSSGWYFICLFKYILGINIINNELRFEPHVPNYWNEYYVSIEHGKSKYNIYFKNLSGNNSGVMEVKLNGVIQENKAIKLIDDGKTNIVEIAL